MQKIFNNVKIVRIIKVFLFGAAAVLVTALVLFFTAFGLAANLNKPPDSAVREVFFEVKAGESARFVGRHLEEEGLIKSYRLWYIINKFSKDFIKAGNYRIEMPMTQREIHNLLVAGYQALIKVTIPEGITMGKTARIFSEAGICSEEDFLEAAENKDILDAYQIPGKTLEGYLYPDTYLFQENYPAVKVVRVMTDNFFGKFPSFIGEEGVIQDRSTMPFTPQEIFDRVILASIVEREYRVREEAALMAGVFYNRLKIGMALQSCATVEYIITEIQGRPHPEILFTRDTEIQDAYNTYIHKGLPPGPISSPGESALNAVFHPAPSDYLYFRLIDPAAGRHYFSRTFDDHIKAGQLYVKR
jgi:UPF0755 protein